MSPRQRPRPPRHARTRRNGLALIAVVLTLLGIAVLLTTIYAVILPQHAGERIRWAALRAELGVSAALADSAAVAPWPWMEGGDRTSTTRSPSPGTRVHAQRVALQLPFIAWQLESRATGQGSPYSGGASALVLGRRTLPARLPEAAMLAAASVQLDSGVTMSGAPVTNPAWSTCAAESRSPALRMSDSMHFSGAGAVVIGAPPFGSALVPQTLDSIGRAIASLERGVTVALVTDTLAAEPVAHGGSCVPAGTSLGEPRRTFGAVFDCSAYAPVARVRPASGTVVVPRAARAQGSVIVDGNLELRAPLELNGVLVVRGALDASQAPLLLNGTLVTLGPAHLGRGSRVAYAACAALGGQLSAAPLRPVARGGVLQP